MSDGPSSERVDAARVETLGLQWDTYVRMTEALVDRRAEANRFYITINTAIMGAIGFLLNNEGALRPLVYVLALFGFLVCMIWRLIIRSQRKIMSSKFEIIHQVEELLPAQPYRDEWKLFTSQPKGKVSTGRLDMLLALIFSAAYLVFLIVLAGLDAEMLPEVVREILSGRGAA